MSINGMAQMRQSLLPQWHRCDKASCRNGKEALLVLFQGKGNPQFSTIPSNPLGNSALKL